MSPPHAAEATVEDPTIAGMRLDVFLAERLGLFSRSQARARVLELLVNGVPARLGRKLQLGDRVNVAYSDPPDSRLIAQDIALDVLFENEEVIVLDKPQGMVVHPGSGNHSGTLVNALLHHCAGLVEGFAAGTPRPGIVHRLDKDTSGVIIVAKNAAAHEFLARQFQERRVRKRYIAMVAGRLPAPEGTIDTRIARDPRDRKKFTCVATGGRQAVTRYRLLKVFPVETASYGYVLLVPKTGRTHQLRVHMKHLGAPVLGDPLYSRGDARFPEATLMLHARSLSLVIPGEQAPRTFSAPIPARFHAVFRQLQSFSPRNGL
jgi:23S rRNA pseudouridine1911/1915/1917 synthase